MQNNTIFATEETHPNFLKEYNNMPIWRLKKKTGEKKHRYFFFQGEQFNFFFLYSLSLLICY